MLQLWVKKRIFLSFKEACLEGDNIWKREAFLALAEGSSLP